MSKNSTSEREASQQPAFDDENDEPPLDDLIQEIHNTRYDGFTFYAMLAIEVEYVQGGVV